jgi:eukaryotic-like serine/threonine-protein kinase
VQRSTWVISALVLVIVVLAIPVVRHLREAPPPPPPSLQFTFGTPPGTELGAVDDPLDAAISPDERQIVSVATRSGATSLWRREFDSNSAEALAGTDGARFPAWSPAGDAVLFFAGTQLRSIALADGAIREIADVSSPEGATWLPDGSILFATQSVGVIRRLQGEAITNATTLRPGDRGHVFPSRTGIGNDFVYTAVADNGRRTVRLVHDGEEHDLSVTSGHGQIVAGYLLVVRDDVLIAQKVNSSGALEGRSFAIVTGVGVTAGGRNLFVASSRIVLSAASSTRARELVWFDANGMRTGTMGETGDLWQVRLSPDDRYAAVTLVAPLLRTLDIVLVSAALGAQRRPLTLALAADSDPVWSPDGQRVAFRSLQKGRPALYVKRAHDADADDEMLFEEDAAPTDWQNSSLLVNAADASSGYDVAAIDEASRKPATVVKSGFNDTDGRWSPDGTWLAYVSDESGRPDIYATRRDGNRIRVSFGGGARPRWSRDGRSLYFMRGSAIMQAPLTPGEPPSFSSATRVLDAPGIRDFDVAHRRDALLALVPVDASPPAPVSVIVDWQSRLPVTQ